MRNIKFRVRDLAENKFEDLSDIIVTFDDKGIEIYKNSGMILDNYELNQFTGIKDIDEDEIYEGDIVLVVDYPEWTDGYLVKFCDDNLCWALYDSYGYSESLNEFDKYRVIGNIYDKSWLLK